MPLNVIGVVLLAALCHATWNFLVKRSGDPYQGMTSVVVGRVPLGIIAVLCSATLPVSALPYVIVGALLHTGYQIFLLNSYRFGDLSRVYPLARGAAPLITALFSILILAEIYERLQLTALIILGIGIISLAFAGKNKKTENRLKTVLPAIIAACFISSYSLVDGMGARVGGTALGFYGCLTIVNAFIYISIVAVLRPGTATHVMKHHVGEALLGGGFSFFAYGLVIWSFTQAPIALVAALRETSVIFALLLGVFVLKEKLTWLKISAVLLTMTGVILLRIG